MPFASATSAASDSLLRSPCFSASTVTSSTAHSSELSPLQPHPYRDTGHVSALCHPHIEAAASPGKRRVPAYAHQPQRAHAPRARQHCLNRYLQRLPRPRPSCAASAALFAGAPSPSCRRQQAAAYRSRPLRKAARPALHPPQCCDDQRLLLVACWAGCPPHATCSPRRCCCPPPPPCWTARHPLRRWPAPCPSAACSSAAPHPPERITY